MDVKVVLKTFNVEEKIYSKFSNFCKDHGISMSKQVQLFMESQIEDKEVKSSYKKKLEKIRQEKYHKFNTVADLRNMIENA